MTTEEVQKAQSINMLKGLSAVLNEFNRKECILYPSIDYNSLSDRNSKKKNKELPTITFRKISFSSLLFHFIL